MRTASVKKTASPCHSKLSIYSASRASVKVVTKISLSWDILGHWRQFSSSRVFMMEPVRVQRHFLNARFQFIASLGSTLLLSACYCTGNDFSVRFHSLAWNTQSRYPILEVSLWDGKMGSSQSPSQRDSLFSINSVHFPEFWIIIVDSSVVELQSGISLGFQWTSKWYLPWISVNLGWELYV